MVGVGVGVASNCQTKKITIFSGIAKSDAVVSRDDFKILKDGADHVCEYSAMPEFGSASQ
ncbi:hypothetical protein B9S53_19675 [Arthrospira sp. O9.13F]|nr:hypothetical protein B9S53_19675 [Arthrospira sp. O9.13F]